MGCTHYVCRYLIRAGDVRKLPCHDNTMAQEKDEFDIPDADISGNC